MKVYVVATNVDFTCIVKARSKYEAVKKAKDVAGSEGIFWIEEIYFEAVPIEEYMEDDDSFQI